MCWHKKMGGWVRYHLRLCVCCGNFGKIKKREQHEPVESNFIIKSILGSLPTIWFR